jgi:hypothetical protein
MSYRVLVKKAKQLGDIMSWRGGKARRFAITESCA